MLLSSLSCALLTIILQFFIAPEHEPLEAVNNPVSQLSWQSS